MSGICNSVGNFFKKNRKKLVFTGGLFGGIYLIGRFAKGKLIELQETIALDQLTKENIKKRYQRNQFDCLTTAANFLPILLEEITSSFNVEIITTKLQHTKNSNGQQTQQQNNNDNQNEELTEQELEKNKKLEKKSKRELWEELKIMSFTRLISSIYIINLITLFTYVQINLIGRYVYMDSVVTLNQNKNENNESNKNENNNTNNNKEESTFVGLPTEIQAKYLAFSYYLIHIGWKDLSEKVKKIVEKEIGPLLLNGKMTYEKLLEIIKRIRLQVELTEDDLKLVEESNLDIENLNVKLDIIKYIINREENDNEILNSVTNSEDAVIDEKLKKLLNETRDIIDSDDFSTVLTSCFNDSFEGLFSILKPIFIDTKAPVHSSVDDSNVVMPTTTKEILVAQILPFITKSIYSVFYGVPNPLLEIIKNNMMQQKFSAIIYSSFEN